jgi:hypothetical protein
MSRMVAVALFSIFAVFTGCKKTDGPTSQPSSPVNSQSTPSEVRKVTVLFQGLMVFHQPEGKFYDVGILGPEVTAGDKHVFSVEVDGTTIQNLPQGSDWTLQITNATPAPAPTPYEYGHNDQRLEDHPNGQWDFSWIVDLDGKEFHPREKFKLKKKGLLTPVIHLPNGMLYTRYKSRDLKRGPKDENQTFARFGFVPETIGLNVNLGPGQSLILTDGNEKVTLVPDEPCPPDSACRVVSIKNVRPKHEQKSDFALYYELFEDLKEAPKKMFDFDKNDRDIKTPLNPYPGYKPEIKVTHNDPEKDTCCMMACTAVRLINLQGRLE